MSNCPNCGAPISGYKCEYCGTVFDMSEEERLRLESELLLAKTNYLNNVMTVRNLYEDAIRAMKRYGRQ